MVFGYKQTISKYNRSNNAKESVSFRDKYKRQDIGYKPKDLMLIPFRVHDLAYALQQDGLSKFAPGYNME